MKKQTFFEILIEDLTNDLKSDPFFDDFKYRKRDASFIAKFKWGWKKIELERWYDMLGRMYVRPYYMVRFDIVHKWFEPFSYININSQRNGNSIYFDGRDLRGSDIFEFERDSIQYAQEYDKFRNSLINNAKFVFNKIRTIGDLYEYCVLPILNLKEETLGDSRMFENMATCKIVAPQNYPLIRKIMYDTMRRWEDTGNYSGNNYRDKMDEIVNALDNIDFSKKEL